MEQLSELKLNPDIIISGQVCKHLGSLINKQMFYTNANRDIASYEY